MSFTGRAEADQAPRRDPQSDSDDGEWVRRVELVDARGTAATAHADGQVRHAPATPFWRDSLLRRMLALADAISAFLVSVSLAAFPGGGVDVALWAAVSLPAWVVLAQLHGLYDRDDRSLRHLTVDELPSIFGWALSGTAATALLLWLTPAASPDIPTALGAWVVAVSSAVVLRSLARFVWRQIVPRERTVIVGTGPLADATRRKLELFPDIHVEVVDQRDVSTIGSWNDLLVGIDRVILASDGRDDEVVADVLRACREWKVKLNVVAPARGMFGTAVRLGHVADLPVVEYKTSEVSRSTLALKRAMDVSLSAVALLVLAPFLALIALAIRLDSRGPAVFTQRRAGLDGRPFRMHKFRTMVADAEARLPQLVRLDSLSDPTFKLRNDPRVTRVGRFLRRTSLDELPQLVNVLKGEMSLVGPRPELVELVERWPPEHRIRLSVKPGLTGPMQVFGRSELSFEEWMAVEREYLENLSFSRDLRIIALTFSAVITGKGAA